MWSVFLFLSSVFLCLSRKTFACLTLPPRSCTVLELLQYHPRKNSLHVSHPPVPFAMISSTTAPPLIEDDFPNDLLLKASAPHCPEYGEAHAREGCVLESKLARVASKTFSVEEVTVLQKEVDRWLTEVTTANTGPPCFHPTITPPRTRSHLHNKPIRSGQEAIEVRLRVVSPPRPPVLTPFSCVVSASACALAARMSCHGPPTRSSAR
jgi:hypothetical protein